MFDWTISVGNLTTIITFLVVASGTVYALRSRVDAISTRLLSFEQELKRLTDILIVQGRQDERMTAMDQRVVNQGLRLDDTIRRINKITDEAAP